MAELRVLVAKLSLPKNVRKKERDKVPALETLCIVCRRLSEASKLTTVALDFGRSAACVSRFFWHVVRILWKRHRQLIQFNRQLIPNRMRDYCNAVERKGTKLHGCWAFIDVYNGHPRRHCFNYQGLATPDGHLVGMATTRRNVLSQSGFLDRFRFDPEDLFRRLVSWQGHIWASKFNAHLSSVCECVEWAFARLKMLWSYLNFDKKMKARNGPGGKLFLVAVLLANCHYYLQPHGSQTTMYFGIRPTTLDEYLNMLII
ncbi:hypothetical protein ACHHYP_20596 [Achlya hypogyna]|uniref:DDE Tnp4 domain-containing protein n=1 Tax=Achlya hypogyna TaxID=1202772 RepID=A0A1V9YHN6_ACHHY|nr:hypothetical protein ACHHYP_20596 [Achlya hypogyna]